MTNIIGIDIGAQGALALLTLNGDLVEVADMPILRDGPKNRASVNAPLLAEIVYRWHAGTLAPRSSNTLAHVRERALSAPSLSARRRQRRSR